MGDETDSMYRTDRRKALGLDRGRELRDDGIKRAVDHAEAVEPNWQARTVALAREWLRHHDQPFFTHELREALEADGLPPPPELRAWGGIPRALVKAGLVRHAGIHHSDKPEQHMAHKAKWVRT